MKSLQVESGLGVAPVRSLKARLVPAGTVASHSSVDQRAFAFAARTRDRKTAGVAYGVTWTQSTTSLFPSTVKSLATGRLGPATETACVATRLPSIQYPTELAAQSMRNRCGAPSQLPAMVVLCVAEPAVRAKSAPPPPPVLKMAHGGAFRSVPKPACCKAAPPNVATN